MHLGRAAFERVAEAALDRLPTGFAELMDNVVIQVEEEPDRQTLIELELDPDEHTLFGLYTGVPLDERGGGYGGVLPDVILLYRQPLLAACRSTEELIREIQLTLLHEIGHHFGLNDDEMHAWEEEFDTLADE
jgi:predicted Zn-dependent protease with MMP-like domain